MFRLRVSDVLRRGIIPHRNVPRLAVPIIHEQVGQRRSVAYEGRVDPRGGDGEWLKRVARGYGELGDREEKVEE